MTEEAREPVPGRFPAEPVLPPVPRLGRLAGEGLVSALRDMRGAVAPDFVPDKGSWVREVRIASRRLRTVLRVLVEPGDPRGIQPLRRRMRALQDELSGSRDLEVVLKWLRREDADWGEVRPGDRAWLVDALAGGAPEEALPDAASWRERVLGIARDAGEVIRGLLPEELRVARPTRPAPVAPAPRRGELPEPSAPSPRPLPAPKRLRVEAPDPEGVRAVRAVLLGMDGAVRRRLEALHDDEPDAEELHDLRRFARKQRYLMEALLGSFPGLGKLRKAVKRFQWLLGQVQDRRVVREHLASRELPEEHRDLRRTLPPVLAREIHELLDEARRIAVDRMGRARVEEALARLG